MLLFFLPNFPSPTFIDIPYSMSIPVSIVWIFKRTIKHNLNGKIKIGNHSLTILLKVEPLNDCSLKTRNVILFGDELFHEKRIFSLFEQELIIKSNFWKKKKIYFRVLGFTHTTQHTKILITVPKVWFSCLLGLVWQLYTNHFFR